jgi:hypothetical protein
MECLQRAVAVAFNNLAQIKKDSDLDALRDRDDIKQFVANLEAGKAEGTKELRWHLGGGEFTIDNPACSLILTVRRRVCTANWDRVANRSCRSRILIPFSWNPIKPPLDESLGLARPGFSHVFRRPIFVPRTQTFCGNRSPRNDHRQSGLNG